MKDICTQFLKFEKLLIMEKWQQGLAGIDSETFSMIIIYIIALCPMVKLKFG
jgi:hypothetical protein